MLLGCLRNLGHRIIEKTSKYIVYFVPPDEAQYFLDELGINRALAFSGLSSHSPRDSDLDHYDQYYFQLIIWDTINNKIIGGQRYRFSNTSTITENIHSSFLEHYHPGIYQRFQELGYTFSEVGRTFLMPEYQNRSHLKLILRALFRIPECFNVDYVVGLISHNHLLYSDHINSIFLNSLSRSNFSSSNELPSLPLEKFKVDFIENGLWNRSSLTDLEFLITELDQDFVLPKVLKPYRHYCNVFYEGYSIASDYNRIMQLLFSGRVSSLNKIQKKFLRPFVKPYV